MPATTTRGYHYPLLDRSEAPDIPADIQRLALDVDADYREGTQAARLAAAHGKLGARWRETDTGDVYHDTGAAWVLTGSSALVKTTDSRLSDARTPTNHAASHKAGGADVIKMGELGLPTASVAMNGQKFTGMAAGAANGESVRYEQIQAIPYAQLALADSVKYTDAAKDANGHAAGSFRAYNNTGNAYASGTLVPMPTEDYDVSNWFDPVTGRYTPQVRGIYEYKIQLSFLAIGTAAAPQWLQLAISRNGAIHSYGGVFWDHGAGGCPTVVAQVIMNGTTDYVQPWITHNHGSAVSLLVGGSSMNYFEGHLIGRVS